MIKPQVHSSFNKSVYKANKYLDARAEFRNTKDSVSQATNLHENRLYNLKKSVNEHFSSI